MRGLELSNKSHVQTSSVCIGKTNCEDPGENQSRLGHWSIKRTVKNWDNSSCT